MNSLAHCPECERRLRFDTDGNGRLIAHCDHCRTITVRKPLLPTREVRALAACPEPKQINLCPTCGAACIGKARLCPEHALLRARELRREWNKKHEAERRSVRRLRVAPPWTPQQREEIAERFRRARELRKASQTRQCVLCGDVLARPGAKGGRPRKYCERCRVVRPS